MLINLKKQTTRSEPFIQLRMRDMYVTSLPSPPPPPNGVQQCDASHNEAKLSTIQQ